MELYLDSVDFKEIEEAFKLGTLTGLTTTPTFMHRSGITDIDGAMLKLAKMVPILQVEALGETADEIEKEADRLVKLGLKKDKTVFKIPVSLEGIKACKRLTTKGMMVNVHLVYTLQQAYMATLAGATYVCPLVGRLQDQGHDALALVEQCVDMVNHYGYPTKIMFSSVRHAEHVRNAINIGVHTITAPWGVMKKLTDNNFTELGTQQFFEHTRLMTLRVSDAIRDVKPAVGPSDTLLDAVMEMTESGLGACAILDGKKKLIGVFTDGDLRRMVKDGGKTVMSKKISELKLSTPLVTAPDALLYDAVEKIKKHKVDNLVVADDSGKYYGILDVQDLVKLNVLG